MSDDYDTFVNYHRRQKKEKSDIVTKYKEVTKLLGYDMENYPIKKQLTDLKKKALNSPEQFDEFTEYLYGIEVEPSGWTDRFLSSLRYAKENLVLSATQEDQKNLFKAFSMSLPGKALLLGYLQYCIPEYCKFLNPKLDDAPFAEDEENCGRLMYLYNKLYSVVKSKTELKNKLDVLPDIITEVIELFENVSQTVEANIEVVNSAN